MPAKVDARLDRSSEVDVLRVFFLLDSRNKKEYRGFVQIPDFYLASVGQAGFRSPGEWELYLAWKEELLRKVLALPCFRHVTDPPMIPDELEFLDVKAIHGDDACPICGERERRYDEKYIVACIACGKNTILDTGCELGHHVCKECLGIHLDKPACPSYQVGKKCPGRDCTLLR